MVRKDWILPAFIATQSVIATIGYDHLLFVNLVSRQDPGSAAYSCHEDCGGAITQARTSEDVCHDNVFLDDYNNCLKCAGPENENIWKYYGETLSSIGESCGLLASPEGSKPGGAETTSTELVEAPVSSVEATIITTSVQSKTTSSEFSSTSVVSSITDNGTAIPTGVAQAPPNAGNALSENIYTLYSSLLLGALYIIIP
ncbi:hypothetical protein F5B22DRAFT_620604 [Xylaria bambusicola]|uniref:uncharacterized protein n=1 Tax=Xylaria bambusicola TaxID=326684 RepID=UPI002007E96F|nr:uncharacterized protein F5B22DRAFT_620604 [Xylaria bambusicola]KAI0508439.1 hypothetical protein F5B22DRAFT_620604 [Xylaria bambusicola]